MAMAAFPHRIISEAAKRITASLEFRNGDTWHTWPSMMNSRRFTRSPRRRAQAALYSQRRRCADDVAFRALHDGKQFLMLRLRHIEFRHRVVEVFAKSVPFTLGDLKVFMGFAHGTACVEPISKSPEEDNEASELYE